MGSSKDFDEYDYLEKTVEEGDKDSPSAKKTERSHRRRDSDEKGGDGGERRSGSKKPRGSDERERDRSHHRSSRDREREKERGGERDRERERREREKERERPRSRSRSKSSRRHEGGEREREVLRERERELEARDSRPFQKLKSTSNMAIALDRHVRPRVVSNYDGNLQSSWWTVTNESTGVRYYWNSDTNITEYERPSSLPPPIFQPRTTCAMCAGFNFIQCSEVEEQQVQTQGHQQFPAISYVRNYPQLSTYPIQMYPPARPVQFPQNNSASVPHRQQVPKLFEANQCDFGTMQGQQHHMESNQQRDMRWVANAPSGQKVTPRIVTGPNSNLESEFHQMCHSHPTGAPIFLNRTPMEYWSSATDMLPPTGHAHLASSTDNTPSLGRSKSSLYFSFFVHGVVKWYYFNLGGGEDIVKQNGSRHELITTLLDEPIPYLGPAYIAVNSLIYRIYLHSEKTVVEVSDIESQNGTFAPSWKEFTPLNKARHRPWALSMGGKVYVVGIEARPKDCFPLQFYEVNEVEVLTSPKSSKWETHPIRLPKIVDWLDYFVVAVEDLNKIVMGTAPRDNCLYVYDVCTHHLERIDLKNVCYVPWSSRTPPVVVGNRLFHFSDEMMHVYDLVERTFWDGTIDGLDKSFFRANCNKYQFPRLVYLGDGKFCLICFKSAKNCENASTVVHFCVFGVPEFSKQGDVRSLHGHLLSLHKLHLGNNATELRNVIIV